MPETQETQVRSLGREDPLEEGTATHSSILAWRTPRTEEPGPWGSHRVSTCSHAPSAGLQTLPLPPLTENQAAVCRSDASSAASPGGIPHPASCLHTALVKRVGCRATGQGSDPSSAAYQLCAPGPRFWSAGWKWRQHLPVGINNVGKVTRGRAWHGASPQQH